MKKGRLYNRHEIEIISKSAIGKSIEDIMKEELVTIGENEIHKGGLGQLIEQFLFGIQTNSDSEPDFMPAGIELKVTPYKKLKDGEYKVYGVIYWSYLLRKKYYKVFLKFSVYNNYYNYYIYKAFSFSFYLIKMVIKKIRIELLCILDSDIYKLNYLYSVLKSEKSIISKYVS